MAKDPAFLFYPGDWLGGTLHLNFACKGAYMDLLMLQFQKDHMTIHMIKHMLGHMFDEIWPQISDKFETDGTNYWNERLKIEKNKRIRYSKSRSDNRNSKENADNHMSNHMSNHMIQHMENENINDNIGLLTNWNNIILNGGDQIFEQMISREMKSNKDFKLNSEWIEQHFTKAIRENFDITTQQAFRLSLIGYLKSCNKNQKQKLQKESELPKMTF